MSRIVCVVPSIRPESMRTFRAAWEPLFREHRVTLVTVWDGETPLVSVSRPHDDAFYERLAWENVDESWKSVVCRRTDAVRNLGFLVACKYRPDFVLTLDDDVLPSDPWTGKYDDPIRDHLEALFKTVPLSWMNTAMDSEYLRGVPLDVRWESPVMLSHGVWTGTPDFDGETQLRIEGENKGRLPYNLPYYNGPIPRGIFAPLCGMSLMVRREALPHLYFAPMGPDSGFKDLHRFADIWMGIHLKREFDSLGWACYTGSSTVHHARASDARTNFERERLGREWNEILWKLESGVPHEDTLPAGLLDYLKSWHPKRERYATLIRSQW